MLQNNNQKAGQVFRRLRKDHGYSAKTVMANIMSVSLLRKFEEGSCDIVSTKLLALLRRLHISYNEFAFLLQGQQEDEYTAFLTELSDHYYKNDLKKLETMYHCQAQNYQLTQDPFYLVTQATAAVLIQDLEPSFVIDHALADHLNNYLLATNDWDSFQIATLGNCLPIINSKMIMLILRELDEKVHTFEKVADNYERYLSLLANTIETLMNRRLIDQAKSVLHHMQQLAIPETMSQARIKMTFLANLLENNRQQGIDKNQHLLELLRLSGSPTLAQSYEDYMTSFLQQSS